MRSRTLLMIMLAVLFVAFSGGSLHAATAVRFADSGLESAVRDTLRAWGRELTTDDLNKLTSLEAQNSDIADLRGLEHAVNLKKLDLTNNRISNLAPLSGLTKLETLNLKWNNISDISALRNLNELTYLSLEDNKVTGISALSGLTSLTRLNLGSNQISDISALRHLTALEQLVAYFNDISDISPLSGLTKLEVVNISDNNIRDISPLMTNLERGGLKGAFINLTNNRLDTNSGSTAAAQIERLSRAQAHVSLGSQSSAGSGTIPPPVEIKPPRGIRSGPEADADDGLVVQVPPELPLAEPSAVDVRQLQYLLGASLLILMAIGYVLYRMSVIVYTQRQQRNMAG